MTGNLIESVPESVLLDAMDLVEARRGFVDFWDAVENGWLETAILDALKVRA